VPLYTLYEPRTDAGGDLFRCFTGADGAVLFVVADVAGHSVLSSYAVASFLGMLSAQAAGCLEQAAARALAAADPAASGEDPLARLARQLNQGIQDGPFAEVPVCVLLGLWSQADGQVQLLNAGIPHGLHLRRGSGRCVPIPLNGTPLGVFPEPGPAPEPGVLTLRIPSTTGAVDLACDRLRELLRELPQARRFDVVLAVREALTNAVLHGNRARAEASVLLGCRFLPGRRRLVVSVADEGPGFDLDAHQPPPDPLSERGRGLPLIRFHAQQVQAEGGTLTLTFHLEESTHDDQ
jgi:anti-sigma regulatory factor (Ser/Thr protein kinase)